MPQLSVEDILAARRSSGGDEAVHAFAERFREREEEFALRQDYREF